MRLIDSARGVDAICAAGSWNRFSIRDSVNCQSREQIEKINGSIGFLTNILTFSTKKCLQAAGQAVLGCKNLIVSNFFPGWVLLVVTKWPAFLCQAHSYDCLSNCRSRFCVFFIFSWKFRWFWWWISWKSSKYWCKNWQYVIWGRKSWFSLFNQW